MVEITIKSYSRDTKCLIFTVPLPRRQPVFMSMEVTDYNSDKSGIVIVDSKKFLQLWRDEPHSIHKEQANGNPESWPNDRKYSSAVTGFSHGYENPVPLAYVSHGKEVRTIVSHKCYFFGRNERREERHYVGFTNGITRTIWLLTQGCLAFPIECEMPGAQDLHSVAAAPRTHFYTIGELAKVARHASQVSRAKYLICIGVPDASD